MIVEAFCGSSSARSLGHGYHTVHLDSGRRSRCLTYSRIGIDDTSRCYFMNMLYRSRAE
jgi:hypothetical protein